MKKQLMLFLIGTIVVAATVVALSAYEAHVINVTAHIENAIRTIIDGDGLKFGTVFPQEYKKKLVQITTSTSFCKPDQRRVLSIDYKIVQKPKCKNAAGEYAPVEYWSDECPEGYTKMPLLCAYLSKTPRFTDPSPYTDYGVLAFHDPLTAVATGTINKDHDLLDDWIIDLAVPCFEGMCSQDWPEFVASHNPEAKPQDYVLPADLEGKDFGCDLWLEVTKIY